MPGSGFIQGLDDAGQPHPIGVDGDRLKVTAKFDLVSAIEEHNRLLRKLIMGLEQYLGNEFPEVD